MGPNENIGVTAVFWRQRSPSCDVRGPPCCEDVVTSEVRRVVTSEITKLWRQRSAVLWRQRSNMWRHREIYHVVTSRTFFGSVSVNVRPLCLHRKLIFVSHVYIGWPRIDWVALHVSFTITKLELRVSFQGICLSPYLERAENPSNSFLACSKSLDKFAKQPGFPKRTTTRPTNKTK